MKFRAKTTAMEGGKEMNSKGWGSGILVRFGGVRSRVNYQERILETSGAKRWFI